MVDLCLLYFGDDSILEKCIICWFLLGILMLIVVLLGIIFIICMLIIVSECVRFLVRLEMWLILIFVVGWILKWVIMGFGCIEFMLILMLNFFSLIFSRCDIVFSDLGEQFFCFIFVGLSSDSGGRVFFIVVLMNSGVCFFFSMCLFGFGVFGDGGGLIFGGGCFFCLFMCLVRVFLCFSRCFLVLDCLWWFGMFGVIILVMCLLILCSCVISCLCLVCVFIQ